MNETKELREGIEALVKKYQQLSGKGRSVLKDVNEADVRADFIDPLFGLLGWNVKDPEVYNRERYIRESGFVDIAILDKGRPVIFIEAKRFGKVPSVHERKGDWTIEERQILNYAANANIKWAILTNFDKFRVFNAFNGLTVLNIEAYWEYKDRIEDLLYLTPESVQSGRINNLEKREEREDIDYGFLEIMNQWRKRLAQDIYDRNRTSNLLKKGEEADMELLKGAVQRVLDRIIIVRFAEDRLILDNPDQLRSLNESWKMTRDYTSVVDMVNNFFRGFDRIHNSQIFKTGHVCEQLDISEEVLSEILEESYKVNFRKFDFDILGNTYETYLGSSLYLKEDDSLGLRPARETRKKSGIYYTPSYVVDYIVKNTVGEVLKSKTPEEVEKIRVLDPACGSGSFLIKAYDYFEDFYKKENEGIRKEKEEKIREYLKAKGNQLSLDMEALNYGEHTGFEREILRNNIFGVDLDPQAAEIASINLMLKALRKRERLPLILEENIKIGNSLISGSREKLEEYFGEDWEEKRPFNWEEEFLQAFDEGLPEGGRGFDVVIGNPPWVFTRGEHFSDLEKKYFDNYLTDRSIIQIKKGKNIQSGKLNLYSLFILRAIDLIKNNAVFGFIIPNNILRTTTYDIVRKYILDNCRILYIVDLSTGVFEGVTASSVIFIFKKELDINKRDENEVKIITDVSNLAEGKYTKHTIKQKYFYDNTSFTFNIFSDSRSIKLSKKIEAESEKLGNLCKYIIEGIVGSLKKDVSDEKINSLYKPFLVGKDIKRYKIDYKGKYICYDRNKLHRPRPKEVFLSRKILIQRISGGSHPLVAALDEDEYYTFASMNNLVLKDDLRYDIKYILAIINSKLINWYYSTNFSNKSELTVNISKTFLEQLPIKQISESQQEPFIELADKMLTLNKQLHRINTNFDRYVNLHPRIKDTTLKLYIDRLPVNDKTVLNNANKIREKVVKLEVLEEGEWLKFVITYRQKKKENKTKETTINAMRCRFEDRCIRKFILYSIREYTTPGKLRGGTIYDQLLRIRLPAFYDNWEENLKGIHELMEPFIKAVEEKELIRKEIDETDKEIDTLVYKLYGLTQKEIKVVEESVK